MFDRIVNDVAAVLPRSRQGSVDIGGVHNLPGVIKGGGVQWGSPPPAEGVKIGEFAKGKQSVQKPFERVISDALAAMPKSDQPTALWDRFQQNIRDGLDGAYLSARILSRNAWDMTKTLLPLDAQGNRYIPDTLMPFVNPVLSGLEQLNGLSKQYLDGGTDTGPTPEQQARILEDVQNHRPIRDIQALTQSQNSLDGKKLSVKLNTKYPEEAKRAINEWNQLGGIQISISGGGAMNWWDVEIKDTDTDHLPSDLKGEGGLHTTGFYGPDALDKFDKFFGEKNIYLNKTELDNFNGTWDGRSKEDEITAVIAHELGHSMGMGHSLPGNVMYYAMDPNKTDLEKNQTTALGPVDIAVFNQIHHHATGGDIKGPGSSIGDKIPAFLSDGEFVVNATAANANRPLLKAINDDPAYMKKYNQQMEQIVTAALTKVKATPNHGAGERVDQSMSVHISGYDVHEAFAKAKLWEQRHAMVA